MDGNIVDFRESGLLSLLETPETIRGDGLGNSYGSGFIFSDREEVYVTEKWRRMTFLMSSQLSAWVALHASTPCS